MQYSASDAARKAAMNATQAIAGDKAMALLNRFGQMQGMMKKMGKFKKMMGRMGGRTPGFRM